MFLLPVYFFICYLQPNLPEQLVFIGGKSREICYLERSSKSERGTNKLDSKSNGRKAKKRKRKRNPCEQVFENALKREREKPKGRESRAKISPTVRC